MGRNLGIGAQGMMAAEYDSTRVFVIPRWDLAEIQDSQGLDECVEAPWSAVSWADLAGTPLEFPCGIAHHFLTTLLQRPIGHSLGLPSTSEIDWGPSLAQTRDWERMVELTEQSERSLVATLRATSISDPHRQYLLDNSDRVLSVDKPKFDDVPVELRRLGDPKYSVNTPLLPFSSRFTPVPTGRLARASQMRQTDYRPRSFSEILDEDAIAAIQEWLYVEGSNMEAISKYGPHVRRVDNAIAALGYGEAIQVHGTLVIGQDQFLELARGIIWDCRGFEQGLPAVPMDFDAPIASQLNDDFIEHDLAMYPDQELVGMLLDGVQFKAEIPLQFVFGPHLTSLSNAYGNVQQELLRLTGLGYYSLHRILPYAPLRLVPQGSTPRKLEPGRDRRTSDGGFPRRPVQDKAGIRAVALNIAIGLRDWLPFRPGVTQRYLTLGGSMKRTKVLEHLKVIKRANSMTKDLDHLKVIKGANLTPSPSGRHPR